MTSRSSPSVSVKARRLLIERGPVLRRYVLLGLVAGIPIFFLRAGTDPFNVPKLALLICGLSVVAGLRAAEMLQGKVSARRLGRLIIPGLTIALPVTLAWLFADQRYWSVFGLFARFQGLIPYLLAVLLGVLVADAFDRVDEVIWSLVAAGAVVGGYAVVQVLGLDPFEWQLGTLSVRARQTLSTLGNPNFTGGFLGVLLPLVVALLARANRRQKTLLLRFTPLIVAGWLLSQSEGGWAAGLAGLSIVAGSMLSGRWPWARPVGFTAAMFVAFAILATVLVALAFPSVNIPFTASERGQWWIAAARMGMESPAVGHGPNAFAIEGVQYRTRDDALSQGYNYTDDPHSVPLSLFSGWGVLGLVGFLFLIGWVVRRGLSFAADDVVGHGLVGAAIGYFVQSLVSIDELSLRVTLWALIGALAVHGARGHASEKPTGRRDKAARRNRRSQEAIRLRKVVPIFLISVGVVAAMGWSALFIRADALFNQSRLLFLEDQSSAATARAQDALAFREEYRFRHLLAFELGKEAIELGRGAVAEQLISEMSSVFSYLRTFPDVPSIRDHGRLLHQWDPDDPETNEDALVFYERAIALDPLNPLLSVEGAEVALAAEDYETAESIVEAVPETIRDLFPVLWADLGQSNLARGDPERALPHFERALRLEPENPDFLLGTARSLLESEQDRRVVDLLAPIVRSLDRADLWGILALAEARLGNRPQALVAIRRALALVPSQENAQEAQRILRETNERR